MARLAPVLAALPLLLPVLAYAQSSTMAGGPSFKVQKTNRIQFDYRQTSRSEAIDGRYVKNFQIVYGIYKGFELSADTDFDGSNRLGAKYSVLIDAKQKLRFGIGANDITEDLDVYLGLVKDFDGYEIHAGYLESNEGQGFIGYRRRLTPQLRFTVDHSTGSRGRTAARFDYALTEHWLLDARLYFPNDSTRDRTHRFGITYAMDLVK